MENIVIRKALVSDVPAIMDYLNHIGKESDNLTFGEEGIGYTVEEFNHFVDEIVHRCALLY